MQQVNIKKWRILTSLIFFILNNYGSITSEITNLIVAEKNRLEFVDNSFQRGIIKGLEMALKLVENRKN